MGGNNTHPTAENVWERIRHLCVSKNVNIVVNNPSVEILQDDDMLSAEIFEELREEFSLSSGMYLIHN